MNHPTGLLLEVDRVTKLFERHRSLEDRVLRRPREHIHAVDGVTMRVAENEVHGIVGESGSGKSTLARVIVGTVHPTAGSVRYRGQIVHDMKREQVRRFRREVQMIFQDPVSCLDPKMKARDIVSEPLRLAGAERDEAAIDRRVSGLLETVGLQETDKEKYPHEFSGGQARRVGVARALALEPKLVVCDEPTSGLDVSVTARIINFMLDIKSQYKLSYVWITHNINLVEYVCDNVSVMYLGQIVESGSAGRVFGDAVHPYTKALLDAAPAVCDRKNKERIMLRGEIPSPIHPPEGCRFHTRCFEALGALCERDVPPLHAFLPEHLVACHRVQERAGSGN